MGAIKDIIDTSDAQTREFLSSYAKRLEGCKDLKEFEKLDNTALANYITAHHDKSAQIANFRDWLAQVQRTQNGKMVGFTITGGIKQFQPDSTKDVRAYYDEVSAVLKNGKSKNKGGIYREDGSSICPAGM